MEKLYTSEEVAARYNVSLYTVREWLKSGKLSGFRINGKGYRVPESALKEFEARNRGESEGGAEQ